MGHAREPEMTMASALEALGLDWRAGAADVRKAYRRLSLKYHPDRVLDEGYKAEAQRRFVRIREAYAFLRGRVHLLRGASKGGGGPAVSGDGEFEELLRRYRERHGVKPSRVSDFLAWWLEGGGWFGETAWAVFLWGVYIALVAELLVWRAG